MKHLIISDLERYNRKQMCVFSRIPAEIHLKKCKQCSDLLETLKDDDSLIKELRGALTRQSDEETRASDKTFISLKNILG